MSSHSLLSNEKFWSTVRYLVQLSSPVEDNDICDELGLSHGELHSYLSFLKEVDCELEVTKGPRGKMISPGIKTSKVTIEFNLLEWLQFQACFPKISECDGEPYYKEVKELLCKAERAHSNMDIFGPAEKLESVLDAETSQTSVIEGVFEQATVAHGMPSFLEESIVDEAGLNLTFHDGQSLTVLPRKVVFLDGHLSLIGETSRDGCLTCLAIHEISGASESSEPLYKKFSRKEIEDFISSLRAVGENEIRLVLKVCSRARFDANVKRQHFANQCMVTNPMGDYIWAASIEPSDDVYAWVESLGSDVEILDPVSFKKGFLEYCEAKLKKLA